MILAFDDYELDREPYELRKAGQRARVEPQVFDMLCLLADNAGRVVTRDEIIERIWDGRIFSETTISTCVKAARQAVGDDGKTSADQDGPWPRLPVCR